MVEQQPDEFFAGVTGRADNGNFLHGQDWVKGNGTAGWITRTTRNRHRKSKSPAGPEPTGLVKTGAEPA
jgi:hypothetical protein